MKSGHESVAKQAAAHGRMLSWWPIAVVLIAGIALSMPLWLTPYAPRTHDSLTHIFNLFSLDQQISAGTIATLIVGFLVRWSTIVSMCR